MKLNLEETYQEVISNSFENIDDTTFSIEYDENLNELLSQRININTESFEKYSGWTSVNEKLIERKSVSLMDIKNDTYARTEAITLNQSQLMEALVYEKTINEVELLNSGENGKKFIAEVSIINLDVKKISNFIEENIKNSCRIKEKANKKRNKKIGIAKGFQILGLIIAVVPLIGLTFSIFKGETNTILEAGTIGSVFLGIIICLFAMLFQYRVMG